MKKYFRTKDGVYKIYDTHNGATNHWGYKVDKLLTMLLDEDDIKNGKTADTIEELVDGYIIDYENGEREFAVPFAARVLAKRFDLQEKDNIKCISAYIKTDKGLIYVAKMNDKGELELI